MSLFDSLNANTTAAAPVVDTAEQSIKEYESRSHYKRDELVGIKYRSRLLGYPAMLATWGFGALGTAAMLTDGVSGFEAHAILGCVVAGGTVLGYKVAKWLIGKREICKTCGASDLKLTIIPNYDSYTEGDHNVTKDLHRTECNGCRHWNETLKVSRSLTAEASARVAAERAAREAQEAHSRELAAARREIDSLKADAARAQSDASRSAEADRRRLEESLAKAQRQAKAQQEKAEADARRAQREAASAQASRGRKISLPASFKNCATCDNWAGPRSISTLRSHSEHYPGDKGECVGGAFNRQSMMASTSCSQWRKWSKLK